MLRQLSTCVFLIALSASGASAQSGAPLFNSAQYYTGPINGNNGPGATAIGDFNGDGAADWVAANNWANSVAVALGNGLGGFGAPLIYGGVSRPNSIAVADLNHDGHLDWVTASSNVNVLTIRFGDGTGAVEQLRDLEREQR